MSTQRIPVTAAGLAALQQALEKKEKVDLPKTIQAIKLAREEGDLRENAGYDAARSDKELLEREIAELRQQIKYAEIIDSRRSADVVELGSTVTIEIDGEEETYTIVGAVEARPTEGRISNESPFGMALLGARKGDVVNIETPNKMVLTARIVSLDGNGADA